MSLWRGRSSEMYAPIWNYRQSRGYAILHPSHFFGADVRTYVGEYT